MKTAPMSITGRRHTIWLAAVTAWTGGCAGPRLEVVARPAHAAVYLDGERLPGTAPPAAPAAAGAAAAAAPAAAAGAAPAADRGAGGEVTRPLPYYGTARLSADIPATVDWRPTHRQVHFDRPFSRWLFPFDFVLECAAFPFRSGRYRNRVDIGPEPRAEQAIGVLPRELSAISARARQAREER